MAGTLGWGDIVLGGEREMSSQSGNLCWKQNLGINWMGVEVVVGVKGARLTLS